MRLSLALLAALVLSSGAGSAELPSRSEKPRPNEHKAPVCWIGGERGIVIPGGGCMLLYGDVTVGVSAGNLQR